MHLTSNMFEPDLQWNFLLISIVPNKSSWREALSLVLGEKVVSCAPLGERIGVTDENIPPEVVNRLGCDYDWQDEKQK